MRQDEIEYRRSKAVNNSLLSAFAKSLEELRDYKDPKKQADNKKKPHFRMGLGVDCSVLNPDEFEKDFIISPSFKEDSTIAKLFEKYLLTEKEWDTEKLLALSSTMGLWGSTKDPKKREANFNTVEGRDLFEFLQSRANGEDRTYLTEEELEEVKKCSEALLTHPNTANFFKRTESKDVFTQVPYYWNEPLIVPIPDTYGYLSQNNAFIVEDGYCVAVRMKILLDIVEVNHLIKMIKPSDLKTMNKFASDEFVNSFTAYGYIRQGALYRHGITLWAKEHYPDYEVNAFRFVVNSFKQIEEPLVFEMSPRDLEGGKVGATVKGRKVKGWQQLVNEYVKQMTCGSTTIHYSQIQNLKDNGAILLDVCDYVNSIEEVTSADEPMQPDWNFDLPNEEEIEL